MCNANNPLLHPSRTWGYQYLGDHLKDFYSIATSINSIDEEEEEKEQNRIELEIKILMIKKIKIFFENIHIIFKLSNPKHQDKINEFKNKVNDSEDIEITISEMWIDEDLGLFSVNNAATFADLYFKVVTNNNKAPPFYQNSNIDLSKDGLEEKIKILSYYSSCLWYKSYKTGSKRKDELILYRVVGIQPDIEYEVNKNYRFITFQSCSNSLIEITKYMDGIPQSIYTIIAPEYWRNVFYIHKYGGSNKNRKEYLILPYTSFEMLGNLNIYLNILI